MQSKEYLYSLNSCKLISGSLKHFTEDTSYSLQNIQTFKTQKIVYNKLSIENFVPRLKPKKAFIIPTPLELNKDTTKDLLNENNSFSEDTDISSELSDYQEGKVELYKKRLSSDSSTDGFWTDKTTKNNNDIFLLEKKESMNKKKK